MSRFTINNRKIGNGQSTYIIAELSANHNQIYDNAVKLIDAAHKAGADAIKLQTYKPDTITINCNNDEFKIKGGTLWDGQTLYNLYEKTYTPWEWIKPLKAYANKLGMDLFSSPFDTTAVDYLEKVDVPAYKIASCEITDHILIKKIAETGKPVIISSGNASVQDLQEAVDVLRNNGCQNICMLKCTAAYPAKKEDANLLTIKDMMNKFNVVGGLSDHTLGIEVPTISVAMGASIIEKHFTLSRDSGSPDDAFSLTPDEFKQMVESVRLTEKIIGKITYGGVKAEKEIKKYRRSLYVVKNMKKGNIFTKDNLKSIRPGNGIHTKHYWNILGKECNQDIDFGTAMRFDFIENIENQKYETEQDTSKKFWNNLAKKNGEDIKTLSWPNKERQELSFEAFVNNVNLNGSKILDIGCGFGDLFHYFKKKNINVDYQGIDISEEIINIAKRKKENKTIINNIKVFNFLDDAYKIDNIDFVIICGTFNCNYGNNWDFIINTIDKAFKICNKGVIFNLITTYVDYKEDYLYYTNPGKIIEQCKKYTSYVNIINDYNKYEYLVAMYKNNN